MQVLMETFHIDSPFIELCKLLKVLGWADNGGHAKAVIAEGHVQVNGLQELRKRYKTRVGDVVAYNGQTARVEGPAAEESESAPAEPTQSPS